VYMEIGFQWKLNRNKETTHKLFQVFYLFLSNMFVLLSPISSSHMLCEFPMSALTSNALKEQTTNKLKTITSFFRQMKKLYAHNSDGSGLATSGFEKFLLKIPNFFPSDKKISSGHVKKYLGQRRVGLLFTASQKYARVGLGPIFI